MPLKEYRTPHLEREQGGPAGRGACGSPRHGEALVAREVPALGVDADPGGGHPPLGAGCGAHGTAGARAALPRGQAAAGRAARFLVM